MDEYGLFPTAGRHRRVTSMDRRGKTRSCCKPLRLSYHSNRLAAMTSPDFGEMPRRGAEEMGLRIGHYELLYVVGSCM